MIIRLKPRLTQQKKKLLGKNGLLVLEAQGVAAQAGILRGDVILGLNNTEVQNLNQFNKQDRKSTRLNSSHPRLSRMPSSA